MDEDKRKIIKTLNKLGVDTRFISLYEGDIYINNLKFSRFSRKKEEEFHQLYPEMNVIRSKLFQKMCIKVSRTIKNQIRPRDTLYIRDDKTAKGILLMLLLEPYTRKYGITITTKDLPDALTVSDKSMNDFADEYINQMITGDRITNNFEEDMVYPLIHIDNDWISDWINTTNLEYEINDEKENQVEREIIEFLDTKIPNVRESIIQSVDYLDKNCIDNK